MTTLNGWIEARITIPVGGWEVYCEDGGTSETVIIPAGDYVLGSGSTHTPIPFNLIDAFNTEMFNAGRGFVASISTTTGLVTITNANATPLIEWAAGNIELRDIFGFAVDVATSPQTGTQFPTAIWSPGCALQSYGSTFASPDNFKGRAIYDVRSSESRAGDVRVVMGDYRFERDFTWPAVEARYVWIANETVKNESWERFFRNCLLAEQSWATPGVFGWNATKAIGITEILMFRAVGLEVQAPEFLQEQWTGRYNVSLPRCILLPAYRDYFYY